MFSIAFALQHVMPRNSFKLDRLASHVPRPQESKGCLGRNIIDWNTVLLGHGLHNEIVNVIKAMCTNAWKQVVINLGGESESHMVPK